MRKIVLMGVERKKKKKDLAQKEMDGGGQEGFEKNRRGILEKKRDL